MFHIMLQAIRVAPGNLCGLDSAAFHKATWKTNRVHVLAGALFLPPLLSAWFCFQGWIPYALLCREKTSFPSAAPWLQNKPVEMANVVGECWWSNWYLWTQVVLRSAFVALYLCCCDLSCDFFKVVLLWF